MFSYSFVHLTVDRVTSKVHSCQTSTRVAMSNGNTKKAFNVTLNFGVAVFFNVKIKQVKLNLTIH